MTRFWAKGKLIHVVSNGLGEPKRFEWQRGTHHVNAIARQWRVDLDWWRIRVWRDYFKLVTNSGLLVVIYRDLLSDQWYLQRLYD
jgi:hypothetical protein